VRVWIVRLQVRREALESFHTFERHAARVMKRHGGAIDRTVVLEPDPASELHEEVHLVRFPSVEAFEAYRADPELAGVRHLRDESVVATDALVGEDGPDYG
jgi:uncharacterized protein (DUF1330 family)